MRRNDCSHGKAIAGNPVVVVFVVFVVIVVVVLVLVFVVVFIVIVVVFALFCLVVVPFVLLCSSREHRPTTPDNQCTSQRWLFQDGLVGIREA